MSKRKKGFPSETKVKRGVRIVHGNKELNEKLGRNDLCPCGSRKRFKPGGAYPVDAVRLFCPRNGAWVSSAVCD
jgi:hypothetical protein